MKLYQQYMCSILRNPEWLKSVAIRYGNPHTQSVGMPELATAVFNLENALAARFGVDEDADVDSTEAPPNSKEFELEGFLKDSEPPKAGP